VVQRQVLYLGEINDSQKQAWCRVIDVRFHFRDPPDNNEGDQRIRAERSDEALWVNVYMKAP